MRNVFSKLFSKSNSKSETSQMSTGSLDYEKIIHLDAEDLAEQGMADAYQQLLPELCKFIEHPAELSEILDTDVPEYKVQCGGQEYLIYSAEEPGTEEVSWARATYFFFLIVNKQLTGTDVQFYAINRGNDLGGLFLSLEQAMSAQGVLPRKADWPYCPELSAPWFGQFH
ncbi:hypothetical protein JBO49_15790 [Serratia fonticola]|uniref:hypothetical protein n=1 Tax=Serratia fonticola TaxID=47917 RepID=UPI00192B366C|nr:hypothetical protein [Serratia fonticola]MBL5862078.1 hypothetical protein [Serratia fonticola]